MSDKQQEFYAVGDIEIISSKSIDEAVQYWYDGLNDIADFSEFVDVQKYVPKKISPESKIFEWNIEALIENLDENYACEETAGDYGLSDKAKDLYEQFKQQVIIEYPVSRLTESGEPVKVKVRDYIEVDHD